jgi:hypothetical protein
MYGVQCGVLKPNSITAKMMPANFFFHLLKWKISASWSFIICGSWNEAKETKQLGSQESLGVI